MATGNGCYGGKRDGQSKRALGTPITVHKRPSAHWQPRLDKWAPLSLSLALFSPADWALFPVTDMRQDGTATEMSDSSRRGTMERLIRESRLSAPKCTTANGRYRDNSACVLSLLPLDSGDEPRKQHSFEKISLTPQWSISGHIDKAREKNFRSETRSFV